MTAADRIQSQTKRATLALSQLKKATSSSEQLAAAQALESAACQLRRALKRETSELEPLEYVVEVWNGKRWAKVRGYEGGPFKYETLAQRMADLRQAAPSRGLSSTEGMQHRVTARALRQA